MKYKQALVGGRPAWDNLTDWNRQKKQISLSFMFIIPRENALENALLRWRQKKPYFQNKS